MNKIIVLIGNICSGKTTFASTINKTSNYILFPIEKLKEKLNFKEKEYDKNQDILYEKYFDEIVNLSLKTSIIIESTGANNHWPNCHKKLKKYFKDNLTTIFIDSNPEICLLRLKENKSNHRINTREELIQKIDSKLQNTKNYNILIKNNSSKEEFKKEIKKQFTNKFEK